MKHRLEHELITVAYQAEHMRPRVAAAFERLEDGIGNNEDLIEAARHFREMGEHMAAKHLRNVVRKLLLAKMVLLVVAALVVGCGSVDSDPLDCDPAECSADCLSMSYGAGFCYAPGNETNDLECWCLDPSPGPAACIDGDQACEENRVYHCEKNRWNLAGDICNPADQQCREYLAPGPAGGLVNRAHCIERGCVEETNDNQN